MHANYKKANAAPRCQYIRLNEQRCTQPALQGNVFCRFHDVVEHPLPDARLIPFVEDATTLQLALMQVIRGLQLGQITRPVAGTILYALQIAAQNLKHFCEEAGHPFAQPCASRKQSKQDKQEEALQGPSLAEILLERLQIIEEEDGTAAKDSAAAPAPAPPCAPESPAVKPEPGIIDKLEACTNDACSSTPVRHVRGKTGRSPDGLSPLGMTAPGAPAPRECDFLITDKDLRTTISHAHFTR
jgi:hypothetical protein